MPYIRARNSIADRSLVEGVSLTVEVTGFAITVSSGVCLTSTGPLSGRACSILHFAC